MIYNVDRERVRIILTIGDKIRILLARKNMKPTELSRRSGVSFSTLSRILKNSGDYEHVGVGKYKAIADILDVSMDYLCDLSEDENKDERVNQLYDLNGEKMEITPEFMKLVEDYHSVNEAGKRMVCDYAAMVVTQEAYRLPSNLRHTIT